jgi:fructokinase
MIAVCGEALVDVFQGADHPGGLQLDARVGGSPLNVAIGLARLAQPVTFIGALSDDFLGERLLRALTTEGVDRRLVQRVKAPTTLSLVGLDGAGSPSYGFHGHGGADRQLRAEPLLALDADIAALHVGSYAMVVEPVAATQRALVEREHRRRLVTYDPNLRLNVEPDLAIWRDTVTWMASRTHVVKVSEEDLHLLQPDRPLEALAREWLGLGSLMVIVTRGACGAVAFARHTTVTVPAPAAAVVDTVGAGDTFQAALLTWLAEQQRLSIDGVAALSAAALHEALAFANAAAAITCSRRGADMPYRSDLPRHVAVRLAG